MHRNGPQGRPRAEERRSYPTVLLLTVYGTLLALLVVTPGFATLATQGVDLTGSSSLRLHRAGAAAPHDHAAHDHGHDHGHDHAAHDHAGPDGRQPTPRIEVRARHLGNLVVDVAADVSLNHPRRGLMKAHVVVFLDMVQMPGAHRQGPLPLRESQTPGRYEAQVDVPMPGDYQVRVVVRKPVSGEETTQVRVGTTP